ncbi:tlde1 domain-containing protein [Erwinia amylovora]|uniref:tlde1 domain-containing protein n=1 Tax=Erwinia amylovora TaxID=552 RepID=UPI003BFA71F8
MPVGRYWIVDAPKGGVYSQARRQFLDFLHNTNHAEWFGLFNSQTMDDYTLVNGTKRTGFRLHPLRPDGSGLMAYGYVDVMGRADYAKCVV